MVELGMAFWRSLSVQDAFLPILGRGRVRYAGNTVAEYALAGLLIIGLAIFATMNFSASMQQAFANLRDDMSSRQDDAAATAVEIKAKKDGNSYAAQSSLTLEQQILLQSSLADKLQTNGANGSTEILALQIKLAAKEMLHKGTIDQARYDILMRLANQAHEVARIEAMVEKAVQFAKGDQQKFNSLQLNYNGQTYSAPDLSLLVGVSWQTPGSLNGTDILASNQLMGGMAPVQTLYNEALAGGALNDPLLRATVDSATRQIMQIGELSEDAVYNFSVYGEPLSDSGALRSGMAEKATDFHAGAICNAGSYTDSGVLCTP